MYTSLNADQSAAILAQRIRERLPFFFLRYGDGAMECIRGDRGRTCDGEVYSPELGLALLRAWDAVARGENVYIGDWLSATFEGVNHLGAYIGRKDTRYESFYRALVGAAKPTWLHFEALLLMRESAALVDFYRAVKEDPRRKLYMGPQEHECAAAMLGAEFMPVPMGGLFGLTDQLYDQLRLTHFDVLLYGAGMAGNIPVARHWARYPELTYVHLGSAMDPLFGRRSRQQQIQSERARRLFKELL